MQQHSSLAREGAPETPPRARNPSTHRPDSFRKAARATGCLTVDKQGELAFFLGEVADNGCLCICSNFLLVTPGRRSKMQTATAARRLAARHLGAARPPIRSLAAGARKINQPMPPHEPWVAPTLDAKDVSLPTAITATTTGRAPPVALALVPMPAHFSPACPRRTRWTLAPSPRATGSLVARGARRRFARHSMRTWWRRGGRRTPPPTRPSLCGARGRMSTTSTAKSTTIGPRRRSASTWVTPCRLQSSRRWPRRWRSCRTSTAAWACTRRGAGSRH